MANEAKIVISAEDKTGAALASVKAGLGGVTNAAGALTRLMPGLVPAVTIAGLVSFARNVADSVDKLNDLQDATGASIENLSALEDVAARNGTSMDTVSTAMVRFNKVLSDAQDPGSQAASMLKQIGLNAKELQDIDPAEALRQTAVALAGFADDGNKARVVQELFGKSIKEVAPFLKDLAEQQQLNAKVTTEQAKAAEQFNKEIFALQKNFSDLGREIGGPLVAHMNAAAKAYRESGFAAMMDVLLNGGAANQQNKRYVQLTDDISGLERSLKNLDDAGVKGYQRTVVAQRLEAARREQAGITFERRLTDGSNESPAETARLLRRPSVGDIAQGAGKGGAGGKTDAQREAERLAEWTRQWNINQAIAAGEAVNSGNEAFQRERAAQAEAMIRARRDAIADEGEAINAANTAYQAYKQQLLDSGPIAQLEKQRQEMQLLAEMFERGEITSDQYLDAVTGRLGLVNNQLEKSNDIAKELGMTFTSAFEDAVIGGKKFGDVLKGLGQDIIRIVLRRTVTEPLGNWITSLLPSFDVGTPYVPRDMVAQIHQGERIIPADQNRPGAMGGITYAPVINIDARADAGAVQATVNQALQQNNKQLIGLLQRQGALPA